MISADVDTGELDAALEELADTIGVAPGVVFKEETKQITQQLIKITPPGSLAEGRAAVERDISKIATPLNPAALDQSKSWGRRLTALIQRKDAAGIDAMMQNARGNWRNRRVLTSEAELYKLHMQNRNARGRTYAVRQLAWIQDWKRHVRNIQSRVGWAKAAWGRALEAAGGTLPYWIQRHAAKAGTVIADFGVGNPQVVAIAHDIKIPRYQQIVDTVVQTREEITQRKIERIVAGKAVNLGFQVIEER